MSRTLHHLCNTKPPYTHTRSTIRHERPWSLCPLPPPPRPHRRSTGAVIELASFVFCVAYLVCVLFCIERSATQPVSPQMFHASRKRERGRMDGGRSGVLQETATARLQHDRVRCPSPCSIDQKKNIITTALFTLSLYSLSLSLFLSISITPIFLTTLGDRRTETYPFLLVPPPLPIYRRIYSLFQSTNFLSTVSLPHFPFIYLYYYLSLSLSFCLFTYIYIYMYIYSLIRFYSSYIYSHTVIPQPLIPPSHFSTILYHIFI